MLENVCKENLAALNIIYQEKPFNFMAGALIEQIDLDSIFVLLQ